MPTNLKDLLGTTIQYTSTNIISARAMREVRDQLCSYFSKDWGVIEPLISDIGDSWESKKEHPVQGTWPKRLANYLHKKLDLDLPDNLKAVIGEIAKRGMTSGTFYGRVINNIEWDRGTFGDQGSCFWTDRKDARTIIPANGGGAVTWFTHERMFEGSGCSRALILPLSRRGYVIFNAYGKLSLEATADALSQTFKLGTPILVELREKGEWRLTDMWFNGGRGIFLPTAKTSVLLTKKLVNLNLTRPLKCRHCGTTDPEAKVMNYPDYGNYCVACAPHQYECKHCHTRYYSFEHDHICRSCYETLYDHCQVCSTQHLKTDLREQDGMKVCQECADSIASWMVGQKHQHFKNEDSMITFLRRMPFRAKLYLTSYMGHTTSANIRAINRWFDTHIPVEVELYHPAVNDLVVYVGNDDPGIGKVVREYRPGYWTISWENGGTSTETIENLRRANQEDLNENLRVGHYVHYQYASTRIGQIGQIVHISPTGRLLLRTQGQHGWLASNHPEAEQLNLQRDQRYWWINPAEVERIYPVTPEIIAMFGGNHD